MLKMMMKLRQGNLTALTFFSFIILGPFEPAHGLGWAGLGFFKSGPAQAALPKPETPGPCRPQMSLIKTKVQKNI